MPPTPPPDTFGLPRRSAGLAAVLGWILPGLGQVYVGRPAKGFVFLAVIGATYLAGGWLSGWTCVNPERDPIWFVAQAIAGGPTALTAWLTQGLEATERLPTYDVGLLYVTVAALMNAVAISDALGTVSEYRAAYAEAVGAWREAEAERLASEAIVSVPVPQVVPETLAEPLPPLSEALSPEPTLPVEPPAAERPEGTP